MLFTVRFEKYVGTEKKKITVWAFFKRGIYEKCADIFFAGIILEKLLLFRAYKVRREFWSQALNVFSDTKASKTAKLEIEKSEEKKTYAPPI